MKVSGEWLKRVQFPPLRGSSNEILIEMNVGQWSEADRVMIVQE